MWVTSWWSLAEEAAQAGLLRGGLRGDLRLQGLREDELHAAGHEPADLCIGGGGHHRHAEVDGPAHLLGVGEDRLEPFRKHLVYLVAVDATVSFGLFGDDQDFLGRARGAVSVQKDNPHFPAPR